MCSNETNETGVLSETGTPETWRRFRIDLSYDGTDFQGWQIQPDTLTVQGELQRRLSALFGHVPIKTIGSSRTDTGVHALGFVVSFSAPPSPHIPDEKIQMALNKMLPGNIRINSVNQVEESFHARYSALAKAYTYVINRGPESPFSTRWSWRLRSCTDAGAIRHGAQALVGTHDFTSFAVKASQIDNPVRTIYRIDVQEFGDYLCLSFIGNGFLYKMVRSMVGALAAVGTGKITADSIAETLAKQDRGESEPTCPPHGLFLMQVYYEEDAWQSFQLSKPPFILDY